jgi:hypothetical protein
MSDKPILENSWGGHVTKVHFHKDGIIGTELQRMGDDKKLDVDGEPLANVVGELATDAVMGRISQDQLIQRLKALMQRLPAGSKGRKGLEEMVRELDAPKREPLDLPEGTPAPVTKLMERLSEIPLARGGGDRQRRGGFNEMTAVQDLVRKAQERYPEDTDIAQMRRLRWLGQELRREVLNRRHESEEGKFDIDRAIREAMDELERLVESMRVKT